MQSRIRSQFWIHQRRQFCFCELLQVYSCNQYYVAYSPVPLVLLDVDFLV